MLKQVSQSSGAILQSAETISCGASVRSSSDAGHQQQLNQLQLAKTAPDQAQASLVHSSSSTVHHAPIGDHGNQAATEELTQNTEQPGRLARRRRNRATRHGGDGEEAGRAVAASNSRFRKPGEAALHLYRICRKIFILLKWFRELRKGEILREHVKKMNDFIAELDKKDENDRKNRNAYFDKQEFIRRRGQMISQENVRVLTLNAAQRTQKQIRNIVMNVSCAVDAFAEYPESMQYAFAGVAYYQKINPHRVILRQGHIPNYFYFIVSGTAAVKITIPNPNSTCAEDDYKHLTVAKLGKGKCFGEIALIHNTTRTATIESITEMELLMITKFDFFKIFLQKSSDPTVEPEYIHFLRQIPCLLHWPVEKLDEVPGTCILHYFRPGTVIVANSKRNDWLYIVKHGRCVLMKKLKYQAPHLNRRNDIRSAGELVERKLATKHTRLTLRAKIDNSFEPRASGVFFNDYEHSELLSSREKQFEAELAKSDALKLPTPSMNVIPTIATDEPAKKDTPKVSRAAAEARNAAKLLKPLYADAVFDSNDRDWKPTDTPIFVEMGTLRERDHFGFENLQFDDDFQTTETEVCLVSRGATLIMISKDLFIKHANPRCRQNLRKIIKPFPTFDILQENLVRKLDWLHFKDVQQETIVEQVKTQRAIERDLHFKSRWN